MCPQRHGRTLQVMEGSQPVPLRRREAKRLARIVASGRFRVQGYVALDPLQPLQPAPQIPTRDPDQIRRILSFEQIGGSEELGYQFPEDAPEWVEPVSE